MLISAYHLSITPKDAIALVVEWQNEKLAEFYKGHKIFYRKVQI